MRTINPIGFFTIFMSLNNKDMTKIEEIWKDVTGFPSYQVSNLGRAKQLGKPHSKYNQDKILKLHDTRKYYGITLFSKSGSKQVSIHRLIAVEFIPNPENKPQVNHKNGIKLDNRPENLEWVTSKENMVHAVATGLHNMRGEKSTSAKLSKKQALKIKSLRYKTSSMVLAKKYNVDRTTIWKIQKRITWSHL